MGWFSKSKGPEGVTLTSDQMEALNAVLPGFNEPGLTPQKLLENLATKKISIENFSEAIKDRMDDLGDHQVAAAYSAIYTQVTSIRKEVIEEVTKIRAFYLVDVIIDLMLYDSIAPEIGTNKVIKVSSTDDEIQKELDDLHDRFNFDQLVYDYGDEMISYGEYTLRTRVRTHPDVLKRVYGKEDAPEKSEKLIYESNVIGDEDELDKCPKHFKEDQYGLLELIDNVDPGEVLAITSEGKVEAYLEFDHKNNITIKEPADFIKFAIGARTIRIDLFKEYGLGSGYPENVKKKFECLPRFFRVGKSVIYPIIAKIKELQLLEALVPATKLSKLTSGTLIGVQLAPGAEIDQGIKVARKVEGLINRKVGVDPTTKDLTIENIMNVAGKFKVVPLFGEKGQLQKLDYKSDEPDDLLQSVEEIRRTILSSVGIPYEIVFGGDEGNKGELLKRYARYLRKLKQIQRGLAKGIQQLIYIHFVNKGIKFTSKDIKIEFYNKLIEIDNLDRLEFLDTTVGLLSNLKGFVMDLLEEDSPFAEYTNPLAFLKFLDDQLTGIGLGDLITLPEEEDDEEKKGF